MLPVNSRSARIAALAITLTVAHPAIASPIRLSHQGRLLDETGAPLEGEHALVLMLTSPDGASLWTDTFETELRSGYYHLILGSQRPLDGELFRDLSPGLSIGLEGEAPIALAETLTHVPYAAVAEWAREAHSVRGGVVDASEVRVNGQTVLQAGATTTLGRVRADQGLQLGAAATAACEAGTRGLLRYTSAGALEVCSLDGWVEVGASEAGTCSIVGECPAGGDPIRAMVGDITIRSVREATLLCSAYDEVLGALLLGTHFIDEQWTLDLACLRGTAHYVDAEAPPGHANIELSGLTAAKRHARVVGNVRLHGLQQVGTNLNLLDLPVTTTFPSLQTVGGGLSWSWASGTTEPGPLVDFMPNLESVGSLGGPSVETTSSIGPRIPLPALTSVGGSYIGPSVDAPNLREIGGTLTIRQPQPTFPALETVGSLLIGTRNNRRLVDPPVPLDSFTSLRRIEGPLTIACVRGWEMPELNAFVDRIGRDNIVGPIVLEPASYCQTLP